MSLEHPPKGPGVTEYIVLVALIGVAAIAVVHFFGRNFSEGPENTVSKVDKITNGDSTSHESINISTDTGKNE